MNKPHLSLQDLLDCGWLGMSSPVWSRKENAGLHQGPALSQLSMVKGTFCHSCVTKGEQGRVSGGQENGVLAEGTAAQRWAGRHHAQAPGRIPLWSCLISPPRTPHAPCSLPPLSTWQPERAQQLQAGWCHPLCEAPSDPPLFLERHCSEVRAGVLSKAPWYQSSSVHQLCYIEKVLSSSVKWGLLALSTSNTHLNSCCEEVMNSHSAQRYLHSAWHMLRTVRLLMVGKGPA